MTCSAEAKEGITFHFIESGFDVLPLLVDRYGVDMLAPHEPIPWVHCKSSDDEIEAASKRERALAAQTSKPTR
jgi:hypothetical protein